MRELVIRWLRIPALPTPGPGEVSLRPSPRQSQIEYARWLLRQLGALFGIVVSVAFLRGIELPIPFYSISQQVFRQFERVASRVVPDLLPGPWTLEFSQIVWAFETFAIVTFLIQLVASGVLLRVKLDHRVYVVGDEQLRLREGIWTVQEQTFTVANIQNMVIRRGPLQSLLGIADLEISTAGGGEHKDEDKPSLHVGRMRSLADAGQVRDRLRAALERHQHSGLGDHAEEPTATEELPQPFAPEGLVGAASGLLDAAGALRQTLSAQAAHRS